MPEFPPHFSQRICPIITAGVIRPPDESIVKLPTAGGSMQINVQPCLGPRCMYFVPTLDGEGKVVNGNCAPAVQAFVMLNAVQQGAPK